jgi:hypothetical protein
MGLIGRAWAFFMGRRCVYVTHGWGVSYSSGLASKIAKLLEKALGKIGFTILCVSRKDYDYAAKELQIHERCLKLPRIKTYDYQVECRKIKSLAVVMRDATPKRYDLVVRAAVGNPKITFFCYGLDLGSKKSSQNLIAQGLVDDVPYDEHDAVLLLSDSEGFPMVAHEAAVHKKLLVISELPIVNDLQEAGIKFMTVNHENFEESFSEMLESYNAWVSTRIPIQAF